MANILLSIPEMLGGFILSEWISLVAMAHLDTAVCQHKDQLRQQLLDLFCNSTTASFTNICDETFKWVDRRQIKFSQIIIDEESAMKINDANMLNKTRTKSVLVWDRFRTKGENIARFLNQCVNLKYLLLHWVNLLPESRYLETLDLKIMNQLLHLNFFNCSKHAWSFLRFAAKHCQSLRALHVTCDEPENELMEETEVHNTLISLLQNNLRTLNRVQINYSYHYLLRQDDVFKFLTTTNNGNNCLTFLHISKLQYFNLVDIGVLLHANKQLKTLILEDHHEPFFYLNYANLITETIVCMSNSTHQEQLFTIQDKLDFFNIYESEIVTLTFKHTAINDSILLSCVTHCRNSLLNLTLCNVNMMISETALRGFLSDCPLLECVSLSNFNYSNNIMVNLFAPDNVIQCIYLAVHEKLNATTVLKIIKKCASLTSMSLNLCFAVKHRFVERGIKRLQGQGRKTVTYISDMCECCCFRGE